MEKAQGHRRSFAALAVSGSTVVKLESLADRTDSGSISFETLQIEVPDDIGKTSVQKVHLDLNCH